jgi:hypothetical protein
MRYACDSSIALVEGLGPRVAGGQKCFEPGSPMQPCRRVRPSVYSMWSGPASRPRVGPA